MTLIDELQVQRAAESQRRFIAEGGRSYRIGGAGEQQCGCRTFERCMQIAVGLAARPVETELSQRVDLRGAQESGLQPWQIERAIVEQRNVPRTPLLCMPYAITES